MSRSKHILFVTTIPEMLAAFLLPFADHFRLQGHQVDAMAANIQNFPAVTARFDKTWDVPFARNPLALNNLRIAPKLIRAAIARGQYDIVHVHTPVAAFVTRFALRNIKLKRPKIIYTTHGFHFYPGGNTIRNLLFLWLEKTAGKWTDHLVVINRTDEAAAKKQQLLPDEQIQYMPGIGIDLDLYHPDKIKSEDIAALRQELNLTEQEQFFLMVAEFTPQKNHKLAIEAFARLADKSTHLVFAGVGATFAQTQALVHKLGLSKRVHFLGFRSDIPVLIKAALAVLLVSQREGLPRSIMEAMSLAKPVIGTDIRGIRDLLQNGAGILVPPNDPAALANAMQSLITDQAATEAIGQKGRQQVAQYELKKIIQLHEILYSLPLK